MAHLCTVQGCAVLSDIGPYIALLANDAHANVRSIYRGDPAAALLHAHGKQTQRDLYWGYVDSRPGYLPANPPGFSTHELRSDGSAYNVLRGSPLEWWQQGFDVDDTDTDRVIREAASHGWQVWRPYPAGSEFHHLNFRVRPRPGPRTVARIIRLRRTLPR